MRERKGDGATALRLNLETSGSVRPESARDVEFYDEARVFVKAGTGGEGAKTFKLLERKGRKTFATSQGPGNGGNGGRGGDVIFVCDRSASTLEAFRGRSSFVAENGEAGCAKYRNGRNGAHTVVRIPVGTTVRSAETGEPLGCLRHPGDKLVIARGGAAGQGNGKPFSVKGRGIGGRCVPPGAGVKRSLVLELRLCADIGLVGIPNAGKSTLLAQVTNARPKIANYPFTTLIPNIGVCDPGYWINSRAEPKDLRPTHYFTSHVSGNTHSDSNGAPLEDFGVAGEDQREQGGEGEGEPIPLYYTIENESEEGAGEVERSQAAETMGLSKISALSGAPSFSPQFPHSHRTRPGIASRGPLKSSSGTIGMEAGRGLVLLDIPGLVEGAHSGVGLGRAFLRHIERCRVIVHIVSGDSPDVVGDFHAINSEMALFSPALMMKPHVVVINKVDLPFVRQRISKLEEQLKRVLPHSRLLAVSAATGEGVQELMRRLRQLLDKTDTLEDDRMADALQLERLVGEVGPSLFIGEESEESGEEEKDGEGDQREKPRGRARDALRTLLASCDSGGFAGRGEEDDLEAEGWEAEREIDLENESAKTEEREKKKEKGREWRVSVASEGPGEWRLKGRKIELAADLTDWQYEKAEERFYQVLEVLGGLDGLVAAGASDGDILRVGGHSFRFHPLVQQLPGSSLLKRVLERVQQRESQRAHAEEKAARTEELPVERQEGGPGEGRGPFLQELDRNRSEEQISLKDKLRTA
uniref:OBG-type G domain-containing protein n=1 Tax=Chromera velia CCMP2878 TaxID=1169474 RepID=A0A0G4GVY6_9ALVE|eukprot:Cvel_23628.t1-p1 / transcript=Cvel_23628.t1 / gene=Cvel_23628 / organism=Chromera_velia_CCMP2878 / gene_product=GTPase obg, putative / transcript_product=GTPase obg, putative / location=Cvel_scaffold2456:7262-15481(-) / protein_length=755 / sequence_SO=supercontig / SO=protein_coding / is_pseudo=false